MIIFSLQGEVPTAYTTACGSALGKWVNRQRNLFRDGKLKIERQEVLESVGLRLEKNINLSEVKEKQAKAKERLRQKQLQRLQQLQAQQNAQQQASTQRTSSTTLALAKRSEQEKIQPLEQVMEKKRLARSCNGKAACTMKSLGELRQQAQDKEKWRLASRHANQAKPNVKRVIITNILGRGIFEIHAPAGRLGVTLTTQNAGTYRMSTYIKVINSDSVLKGNVNLGDIILSIDGEDVSHLDANEINSIMAGKSEQIRVLRFKGNTCRG